MLRIGIDLGGTKIEIIVLSLQGATLLRKRVATPNHDYAGALQVVRDLVLQAEAQLGAQGTVGVGMPGALSTVTGLVKNSNSIANNGKPLQCDLQTLLDRDVRVHNDANCFAMSEATDGAAAGLPCVFGVIAGTGVGGGLVVNGRLLGGVNAIAGEWGHNPLPPVGQSELSSAFERGLAAAEQPGPRCYCGRFGCVETWLSGPGFEADYKRSSPSTERSSPSTERSGLPAEQSGLPAGHALPAPEIIAAMRRGETAATAAFERYADRMARSLAMVINIVDPDAIVLGGGISNIDEVYQAVPARWGRYVFSDHVATRLLRNAHGDSSGVRGAAWLWND